MIISEDESDSTHQIKAYEPGLVTVGDQQYNASLIISAKKIIANWPVQKIQELTEQRLQSIIDCQPDIVLFGVGDNFVMPDASHFTLLYQHKIGIEFMDNAAACRTYIALSAEGRNVVAVLLIR